MRTSLPCVLIAIALTACATQSAIRGELDESIKQYNYLLRWHKLDAASFFTSESLSEEFRDRVQAAKNMNIVDYRIKKVNYNEEKGEASVQVEIDYYTLSSNILKTLLDIQRWVYIEENGNKQWRLISLLPEFP